MRRTAFSSSSGREMLASGSLLKRNSVASPPLALSLRTPTDTSMLSVALKTCGAHRKSQRVKEL